MRLPCAIERDSVGRIWHACFMTDPVKVRENAAATAALIEAGIAMMRQNLRRNHPGEDDAEIESLLRRWLYRMDDPIPGDVAGPVRVRYVAS